jgi:hypothetical protein
LAGLIVTVPHCLNLMLLKAELKSVGFFIPVDHGLDGEILSMKIAPSGTESQPELSRLAPRPVPRSSESIASCLTGTAGHPSDGK